MYWDLAGETSEHWDLGGLIFAAVRHLKVPRTSQKQITGFITEVLKTEEGKGHGRFGPAAFGELARRMQAHGVTHVELIVKMYGTAEDATQNVRWERTQRAVELYETLGFRLKQQSDTTMYGDRIDPICQQYMVVDIQTLVQRTDGAVLKEGAAWIESERCRTTGKDRKWFEVAAVTAMELEHGEVRGGDGAAPKTLVPPAGKGLTRLCLYAAVPRARAAADEPELDPTVAEESAAEERADDSAPMDESDQSGDYAYTAEEQAGEYVRNYTDTPTQNTPNNVESETAAGDGPVEESWGDMDVRETLDFLLLERLRGDVLLSGGRATYVGVKVSLDAALVRRAKRGRKHWTTLIVQVLCTGVRDAKWGKHAVLNQLHKAQSPSKFAKVRCWNGKDDRANFEAHVTRAVEQMLKLQKSGMAVEELLCPLPPCLIKLGAETEGDHERTCVEKWEELDETHERYVKMAWHGGHADWGSWAARTSKLGAVAREVIVKSVLINPRLNMTLDGGAWAAAAGVRVSAERSSIFDGLTRYEHSRPFEWVWLEEGDSVRTYCERKRPGDAAYLALAQWAQDSRRLGPTRLHELTRLPERVPLSDVEDQDDMEDEPGLFRRTDEQRHAEAERNMQHTAAALNGPGAEALTTWGDERLRALSPTTGQVAWLQSYVSRLETLGIEIPVSEATLVRMPCAPEKLGSRDLPDAVWGDLDVISHACLCILHAAMRTGENWFTRSLSALLDAYPTDGDVHTAVDEELNPALKKLGLRPIKCNPDTKKVYAASMDGTSVEALLKDLALALVDATPITDDWGLITSPSVFLRGVAMACRKCGSKGKTQYGQLVKALPLLRHWVIGMGLAMRMRPEEGDYNKVKEHLALYVVSKLHLWPCSNTWYDNECLYTMGQMHEDWGSLRLMSQEGMEAWQKQLNEVLRLGNGFANAGAIPKATKKKGKAAVEAYKEKRAADKPSSARWIYEQGLLRDHAHWQPTLCARDALRKAGKEISSDDYSKYWQRYMVCAAMRCRLRARVRRCAQGKGKYFDPARKSATAEQKANADAAAVRPGYYADLLAEYHAYYSVPVEYTAEDLDEEEKRRQLLSARKGKWAKSVRESVYSAC